MLDVDLGPAPSLGYAASPLDRLSGRRHDEAFLAELAQSKLARAYALAGEAVVLKKNAGGFEAAFTFDELGRLGPIRHTVFLGLLQDKGQFAAALDPAAREALKAREELLLLDLRSIIAQGLLAPEAIAELAGAKALLHWHERHGFCANCGAATRMVHGGWRRDCPACNAEHFPRTDPVVIMLATRGEECLLGRQPRFPEGMWSCLAGFVEPGESIEDAVRRETHEEAGLVCGRVAYFASQPWPFPMSLMIGCRAEALAGDIVVDESELEAARWFGREEIAQMLTRRHPAQLFTPPPFAIAHHLIRAWAENPHVGG